jgi:hypothetical protein
MEVLVEPKGTLGRAGGFAKANALALISGFIALNLVLLLFSSITHDAVRVYWQLMIGDKQIYWVLPVAGLLLWLSIVIERGLERRQLALLEWSPWGVKANINEIPIRIRGFGWLYLCLLAYCVPLLAWFEELVFRRHPANWVWGFWVGIVAFGVAHLLACVSVRMIISISFAGGGLVVVYMMAGFWAAVNVHATFNLIALGWIAYEVKLSAVVALTRIRFRDVLRSETFRSQFPTIIKWHGQLVPLLTRPNGD